MSSERTNDENLTDKNLDCKMCENLEKYKILYQAYADEIKNLWQRSVFLATFMVLVWTGYGALQLKTLDKEFDISLSYCLMSIGLCAVIIVLSLLWIAMAKGSKFIQKAHEEHIKQYDKCNFYCHLDTYEETLKKELCRDLFFCGTLKAYRYSPSRINIALGWLSLFIAFTLFEFHCLMFSESMWLPLVLLILACCFSLFLKGKN